MRAVVMAGGEGTRLRPLTECRAKPMVELLGRPVLERTVERLRECGVRDICFTLRYRPGEIEDAFGSGERWGVRIEHRVEREALGTAGSVRACRDFIGGEDVLVISGDGVCTFDLAACVREFKGSGAGAGIVTCEHPEPTSYGLVLTDSRGFVTAFSEKPDWERVLTNRVNTGIYILTPGTVDMIPEGRPYDFGRDLFPRLVREGVPIRAIDAQGYWCDVGSPEAYRQCCFDLITNRYGVDLSVPELEPGVRSGSELKGVTVTPPVWVDAGCRVEAGSSIGPNAVLGRGTVVRKGAAVRESVVNGAELGHGSLTEGAIVSRSASVGEGAQISPGCVLGDNVVLGERAVLLPDVRISCGIRVPAGRRVTSSLTGPNCEERPDISADSVITGGLRDSLTPSAAVSIGAALAGHLLERRGPGARLGLAYTGGEGARVTAEAISCGAAHAGAELSLLDADFEAELSGAAKVYGLDLTAFVRQTGERVTVTVLTPDGSTPERSLSRRISSALAGERTAPGKRVGSVSTVTGTARAYVSTLQSRVRRLYKPARPMSFSVSGQGAENRALRLALAGMGFQVEKPGMGRPSFTVSQGGFRLTATDERGRRLDELHTRVLSAQASMRLGAESVTLDPDSPAVIERLAGRYGCTVRRVPSPMRRDAIFSALLIAAAMARDSIELTRLADDLPPFARETREVRTSISRAKAMRLMAASMTEFAADITQGLTCDRDGARVRLSPNADGSALVLTAEAVDGDSARQVSDRYERAVREICR